VGRRKRGIKLKSPDFLKFRVWLDKNQALAEEESSKLKHFLDSQGLVLFFKKDKDYFGAGEDSRVVFARLKNPDEETPKGWEDEATFTATNLGKMVKGHPSTHVFDKDDIKKIKVVDKEQVIDSLKDTSHEGGARINAIRIIKFGHFGTNHDRDDAPNFVRADEEE
jgi:hypothetical protein